MSLLAVAVGDLAQVIWVSVASSVGITAAFSFAVVGTARSAEARRTGRARTAIAYGTLSAVFLFLFAVAVVLGVHIMLSKD